MKFVFLNCVTKCFQHHSYLVHNVYQLIVTNNNKYDDGDDVDNDEDDDDDDELTKSKQNRQLQEVNISQLKVNQLLVHIVLNKQYYIIVFLIFFKIT